MYRLMQPSDRAEILALWQRERGDGETFVTNAIERFAGVENVYVAEENDHIEAVAMAVPVTLQGRPGCCLYGLTGQGSLILAGLVDHLCAQQKLRGAGFVAWCPPGPNRPLSCRTRASSGRSRCGASRGKWSGTCGAKRSSTP